MKKILVLSGLLLLGSLPTFATAEVENVTIPEGTIKNTKGFAGISYNRQDLEEPGSQIIINDHSAFNININLFKKGSLFKGKEAKELTVEEK